MTLFIPMKLIIVYITFASILISTQKSPINSNKLSTKGISECQRCKLVSDTFNYWLDKTKQGKHDGGDAAWEETKLKSYARSEMRLVEIQEKLCSEVKKHRYDCYSLLGEVEQLLDKWWFDVDPNASDLYTWLCIDNLQYCCPSNHYGALCIPCPLGKDNKICGGKGKCNGDGTRKGDGRCICKKGFAGIGCDECAYNFYNSSGECKPCHKACDNCRSAGVDSCVKCATGWSMESGICIDNNECMDASICKSSEYCINRDGSYNCMSCNKSCQTCQGPGSSNCISCHPNHVLFLGNCINIELQNNLLIRLILYLYLFIIAIIVFRKLKRFSSLIILIISLLTYYIESSAKVNVFNIINSYIKPIMYIRDQINQTTF